jgi:hypothetical protein
MRDRIWCYRDKCTGEISYHEKTGKYSCNVCCRIYTQKEIDFLKSITLRQLKPVTLR